MRLACVAFGIVLVGAGCGSGTSGQSSWEGPPEANAKGVVETGGFVEYAQSVDERWERSAALAAGEFLRLDERRAARTTVEASGSAEGIGPQTVVVTLDGLPDDSVRSEHWTLRFDEQDGVYTLLSARREQRCRPGRGHEGYAPGPCV